MSNCKVELNLTVVSVDIRDEKDIIDSLESILEVDLDFVENSSAFREDTIDLGYETECERIVAEYIKEKGMPKDMQSYRNAVVEISEQISNQEFFAKCELKFEEIDDNRIVVAFATGGNY